VVFRRGIVNSDQRAARFASLAEIKDRCRLAGKVGIAEGGHVIIRQPRVIGLHEILREAGAGALAATLDDAGDARRQLAGHSIHKFGHGRIPYSNHFVRDINMSENINASRGDSLQRLKD
jgi:hypothetical protein